MSMLTEGHNPAHVLQADQHCALCIHAHNIDHSLPTNTAPLFAPLLSDFSAELTTIHYVETFVRTSGNRDPPHVS
ncbi:hypothetical protein [Paraglaciecola hydrolytica]|uniref:hypothetical protein n=1 Tax=Paraglaciecola hydrolytica TaxID=1799789 RepID=UPI0010422E9E|nr:hypothetical protein [Paraglaciecola hydrolytica]